MTDYDRIWDEVYGDLQDVGPTHRHMIRLMRRTLAPLRYNTALDVGIGFGHNIPALTGTRSGLRLSGVDVSERAVEHVRAQFDVPVHKLDVTTERLPEMFELVCCALVMEHLADDEAALANMRAMCSKYLLIVTIGGQFERYRAWEDQMGHVRNYGPGELERKIGQAGFQLLDVVRWGFPFYSPIVRTLQNRMRATRELSLSSRLIARILYPVFFLNSSRRGDLLLVLARPR